MRLTNINFGITSARLFGKLILIAVFYAVFSKFYKEVSQKSIHRIMDRLKFDNLLKEYVIDTYSVSTTKIEISGKTTNSIRITSGVKQGDPLSPYIFNLIVDELIEELEGEGRGLLIGGNHRVSCLAYADDLILMPENRGEANHLLKKATSFFSKYR